MPKLKKKKPIRYRSAITGKFVPAAYAKRYPHRVVGERIKPKTVADPLGHLDPRF